MTRKSATRQRGAALLLMVMIVGLGATWYLVSRLNAETGTRTAVNRARNAEVLNRAKLALIGYVARLAAQSGENNPGRLPCPEAANNIATNNEGVSAPWVGPPATTTCNSVGRLPWRTLGLEKLVDASGEPLWFVVGPAWRLTTSSSSLVINSNTSGDITVDGQQVVAIIIAPGPAMNSQASTGCTARNQTRSAPSSTINALDYIECFNSGALQLVTTAPSTSANDQLVRISVSDIMPAIEAAIASRIEREIVPALNTVYKPSVWGFSGADPVTAPGYADGKPLYPFAVPFIDSVTNPGPNDLSGPIPPSSYLGVAGTYKGLLPFNQTNCTASASNPRCLPSLIAFQGAPSLVEVLGYGYIQGTPSCSWDDPTAKNYWECTGQYHESDTDGTKPVRLEMTATLNNVAMGLRAIDAAKMTVEARSDTCAPTCPWQAQTVTYTTTMNANGSVTLTFRATMPNIDDMAWGTYAQFRIRLDRSVITDHSLLDTTNGTTGWFARNEWYRLIYYSVAQGFTTNALAAASRETACPTSTSVAPIYPFTSSCLSVASVAPANSQRAILILAGSSINGTSRPSSNLADYLDFGNATGSFERRAVAPGISVTYADTGSANAYAIPVTSIEKGTTLQFKAANANTGASTLTTTATGLKTLVNFDGSALPSSAIQKDAAVQASYDGAKFLLTKRPFNDRIVVIGSN